MRHHGWELPYHPLQVVAIAVFVSLAFAFYVFFIPFLGAKVLEYHVIAVFSPLVILVFALYIRCAAANPADPGIDKCKRYGKGSSRKESLNGTTPDAQIANGKKTLAISADNADGTTGERTLCTAFCASSGCLNKAAGLLCPCFAGRGTKSERSRSQEDLLYCSLCEAEIFKYSKHCRACDKCVDGFDHHCRWINNCIGKKNYKTFVALMVAGLSLLILQWAIGIFVIVRCLLNRDEFEDDIVSKLGSSFSLVPFIVVVALCTVLAMLATFPLGQLFFFHLILIHKGISTYDYIVAMRERDQLEGDIHSSQSSPVSSVATAVSGVSSLGALQKRPWCTPPRLLVEQQDTLVKDPLGGDIEQGKEIVPLTSKKEEVQKKSKKPVKISPWKLARLNVEDASKAAERARENSSVLRPIANDASVITETDNSSIDSFGRSPAAEIVPVPRKTKRKRDMSPAVAKERSLVVKHPREKKQPAAEAMNRHASNNKGPVDNDDSIAPLQLEARSAFWPSSMAPGSSAIVPSIALSPDERPLRASSNGMAASPTQCARPWLQRSVSDGYEASGGESADDSEHGRRLAHAWNRLKLNPTFMNRSALRSVAVQPPPWVNPLPNRGSKVRFSTESGTKSKAEASILKHVNMGWSGHNSQSERFAASTEDSNSSPSQYNSPDRDSDFFSAGDTSNRHKEMSSRSGSARSILSPSQGH